MDSVTLSLGLLLPWALGVAALLAARDAARPLAAPGEITWLLGAGYLAGALLLTFWMRALSLAGVRFGAAAIALPLLAVAGALLILAWRRGGGARSIGAMREAFAPPAVTGLARAFWWGLLAWIALRFALLALEVASRPLFPWEAWIGWATKARVWFEFGRITEFVGAREWFAATGNAWFDASPANPATLPLLQVWASIALGNWDDALMNWPWWQIAVALTLAVYGGLRRLGATSLEALVGAYFVASLPLANAHVALAGYADLPLAAYFAVAVLAFLQWAGTRTLRDAALAACFAAACPLIKIVGAVWLLALLPGVTVALAPRQGRKLVAIALGVIAAALVVLAQTSFVVAGHPLHLDFAPAWTSFSDSLFLLGNWNLLWYGVIGAALLAWRQSLTPPLLPLAAIVATGLFLVSILLFFPGSAQWLADAPGVDRAMLHLAPVLVVFMVLAFRAFDARWTAAHPLPIAPDAASATAATQR
jgi:hypothetical protein